MNKKKKWKPISKQEIGIHVSQGSAPTTFTYAHVVYLIRECDGNEFRERIDYGPPIYAQKYPELALCFTVVGACHKEIRAASYLAGQKKSKWKTF